jgi:hypothetical protein
MWQMVLINHLFKFCKSVLVPVTIVSRCQSIHIGPAYDQATQAWIEPCNFVKN